MSACPNLHGRFIDLTFTSIPGSVVGLFAEAKEMMRYSYISYTHWPRIYYYYTFILTLFICVLVRSDGQVLRLYISSSHATITHHNTYFKERILFLFMDYIFAKQNDISCPISIYICKAYNKQKDSSARSFCIIAIM